MAKAAQIDAATAKLAQLLSEQDRLTRDMQNVRPADSGHWRRCDAAGDVHICLEQHLGRWFGQSGRSRDPRHGRQLDHLMQAKLASFLFSAKGIQRASAILVSDEAAAA